MGSRTSHRLVFVPLCDCTMKLRGVTFENWLRGHPEKAPRERWLRELYPWPVLARVDCDEAFVDTPQRITHDGVDYIATLLSIRWQADKGTHRYRVRVESDGIGWHARSFADNFDMVGAPEGTFVTLFHAAKEEPLEKIARAFFGRRWDSLDSRTFATLAVSRFLAASLIGEIATEAFAPIQLDHYPVARLAGSEIPMLASGDDLWIGQRFYSEDAFAWSRRNSSHARSVVGVYLADTKYQFRTDLPRGAEVRAASDLDGELLEGKYEDLIRVLIRRLEVPNSPPESLEDVLAGRRPAAPVPVSEGDVHEALAVVKTQARSKDDLRYQLAAAVVLNAWIEDERRLGYPQRKRFYAFKQHVDRLARWAVETRPNGVEVWREEPPAGSSSILFVRIDNVDFSFNAIPLARELPQHAHHPAWSGVRLKPIAPLVLHWAREVREQQR